MRNASFILRVTLGFNEWEMDELVKDSSVWLNINKTIIRSVSYEQLIRTRKVKDTSSIAATHRHVSACLDEADWNLTVCLCACVQPTQPEAAAPECGETADWPSLYELITPLAFLSPQPPYQAVPSGNSCITEICSSVQGALLDNFLLTAHPPPSLPPTRHPLATALSPSLCRGWNGDVTAAVRAQLRLPAAGRLYWGAAKFAQTERTVLHRLNKAEGKSKCWGRLKECEQSSRRVVEHNNVGETLFQQAPNFANIHPRAKNYNPSSDVCPPTIPTSSFCCCRCCIHKQAVRCLGVKLFLSISAIIEWVLL